MKRILVLTALAVGSGLAAAADFSYKGLRIGDPATEVQAKLPDYRVGALPSFFEYRDYDGCLKLASSSSAMDECSARVSVGGAHIQEGRISVQDGVVRNIELSIYGGYAAALEGSLVEAYGQPVKLDRPVFKNRMGAEFQGYLGRWETETDVMTYFRNGDKSNTLRITSKAEEQKRMQQERDRVKAGAKDF